MNPHRPDIEFGVNFVLPQIDEVVRIGKILTPQPYPARGVILRQIIPVRGMEVANRRAKHELHSRQEKKKSEEWFEVLERPQEAYLSGP